jgi:hypothetical protein
MSPTEDAERAANHRTAEKIFLTYTKKSCSDHYRVWEAEWALPVLSQPGGNCG